MKVHVVDPPAYTPPYDHALCAALGAGGVDVELLTTRFPYGAVPAEAGYTRREYFYRHGGSRPARLAQHAPDMLRYRVTARQADVVHFQWLTIPAIDAHLLPRDRPLVLTAHDILPREPLAGSHAAQRRLYRRFDAVIAHSNAGRARLIDEAGVDPARVHVIPHGAFTHLAELPEAPLPPELRPAEAPVVLYFGLIRPYKGLEVLLEAWQGIQDAELWIVGRPRIDLAALRTTDPTIHWVPRFVTDLELAACFRQAAVVVLPYRETEQSGVLATALAFAKPVITTDVGGFSEIAAAKAAVLVPPADAPALTAEITALLASPGKRQELSEAASRLAHSKLSWRQIAKQTTNLYASIS